MSVEALAVTLHHSRASGNTLVVLLGIANHEGDGGAYPKVATLARYSKMTTRNVRKAIARLVEMGELQVEVQAGGRARMPDHLRPNRYEVMVRCPAWCDRTTNHRDTRTTASRQQHLTTEADAPDEDDLTDVLPPVAGDRGRGVAGDRGAPVAGDRPEPSLPTSPPLPPSDHRPCTDCGQDEERCTRVQARWAEADRHPYRPSLTLHAVASRPTTSPPRRARARR